MPLALGVISVRHHVVKQFLDLSHCMGGYIMSCLSPHTSCSGAISVHINNVLRVGSKLTVVSSDDKILYIVTETFPRLFYIITVARNIATI